MVSRAYHDFAQFSETLKSRSRSNSYKIYISQPTFSCALLKASRPVHPRGLAIQRVFRRSSVPERRHGRAQYSSQLCSLFFVSRPARTWCLHQQNGLDPKRGCKRGSESEVISMLPPCNRGLPAPCARLYSPNTPMLDNLQPPVLGSKRPLSRRCCRSCISFSTCEVFS